MQRIQCEVCGSTSLIKRNDIYECQHCGMQYETDAVRKMLVEIDHSSEVENYLKRADKFKEEGDLYEAKEYYNKALDFDASNQAANDSLERIRLIEKWQDYNVCNKNINKDKAVEVFMNKILLIDDIACDVYKHFKIINVVEKYVLGIYYECQLEYNWHATACHNYHEYYYSNGQRLSRIKTRRNPVCGIDHFSGEEFFLVSDFTKIFSDYPSDVSTSIRDKIEQSLKKGKLNYVGLNPERLSSNCGISIYDGNPIDITFNNNEYDNKKDALYKNIDKRADREIYKGISADRVENFNWSRTVNYRHETDILIPIIVIQYMYKGTKYLAVFDAAHTNILSLSYPGDVEVLNQKKTFDIVRKKTSNFAWFITTACILITMFFVWKIWTFSISNQLPDGYVYAKLITDKQFPELHETAIMIFVGGMISLAAFVLAVIFKIKQFKIKNSESTILNDAIKTRYKFKKEASDVLLTCRDTKNAINFEAFSSLQSSLNDYKSEIRVKPFVC